MNYRTHVIMRRPSGYGCAACVFTTTDLIEVARHVVEHQFVVGRSPRRR